jgi:alpha-glucosidase
VEAATWFSCGSVASTAVSTKALALAQGALKAGLLAKLKVALAICLGLGLIAGWVVGRRPDVWEVPPVAQAQPAELHAPNVGDDDMDPGWEDEFPDLAPEPELQVTAPPKDLAVDPFYKKYISAGGLPILSSEKVSDAALLEAAYLINAVLDGREDIREAMISSGTRFLITHATEKTTDLPERRHWRPKRVWDTYRGVSGLSGKVHSCCEENLLHQPEDAEPYTGRSILIHTLARAILHQGVRQVEPGLERQLRRLFNRRAARPMWRGAFDPSDHMGYWAQAVQAYFDATYLRIGDDVICTREDLAVYDPEMFALVDQVFRNHAWRYQPREQWERR